MSWKVKYLVSAKSATLGSDAEALLQPVAITVRRRIEIARWGMVSPFLESWKSEREAGIFPVSHRNRLVCLFVPEEEGWVSGPQLRLQEFLPLPVYAPDCPAHETWDKTVATAAAESRTAVYQPRAPRVDRNLIYEMAIWEM
jgi:hypothetical protein